VTFLTVIYTRTPYNGDSGKPARASPSLKLLNSARHEVRWGVVVGQGHTNSRTKVRLVAGSQPQSLSHHHSN
jgi:hypothetical protein